MSFASENVPVFNESDPWGGNPQEVDVNAQYVGFEYHYTYLITCAFIVWPILPGIGMLYSGLARRKGALTLIMQSFLVAAVITFQWMFWGFSLTYSRTAGPFIGDLANFGMRGVMAAPSIGSPVVPDIVYAFYQLLFCACTVQIVIGGAFERGRIIPSMVFAFCWATIVYCPLAEWTWNPNGWLFKLPALDFAGGGPVHIASGWSALAYALILGKRHKAEDKSWGKPHNTTLVFLGTVFIWLGWFGFNGGSALNASLRSMAVIFNTNAAAATGMLGWVMVDYVRYKGKFSLVGACEGVIAGLVGITPAAGYVHPWLACVIGFITGATCSSLQNLNRWMRIDDGMEVFKLHGVGGMVGAFLTGLFATSHISKLDGITEVHGAIDGNGIQVAYQIAEIVAISSYAFVVSSLLLLIMKYIPGLHLRVSEDAEHRGLDQDQFVDEQIGDWNIVEHLMMSEARNSAVVSGQAPSDSGSNKVTAESEKRD